MIEFDCEHCGQHIRVRDDAAAGKTGQCQHCGRKLTVPSSPETITFAHPRRFDWWFAWWLVAAPTVAGVLMWLTLQAKAAAVSVPEYYQSDRFRSDYADSATANAVESIESTASWFSRYGLTAIEFWLIVIALMLLLVLVQLERLIATRRRV